jgi:hypothetical protein
MDDEKYFNLSNSELVGNDRYYTSDKSTAPVDIKYKFKMKYEPKVLVWVAISANGISNHYVHTSKNAINHEIYIKECLNKRLLPFINEHHADKEFVFWPDMATSHYANKTIDWFNTNNIEFVQKCHNPPNLPQARLIETFWAILSRHVYSGGCQAKTPRQLVTRINRKIKEIKENDPNLIQRLMAGVKTKLRKIADNGVYSVC